MGKEYVEAKSRIGREECSACENERERDEKELLDEGIDPDGVHSN